jgi:anti-anti-sigma factor
MTADAAWWLDDADDVPECPLAAIAYPRRSTIVTLTGEHDIANEDELLALLADTVSMDDSNVVLDLGGVTYMGAATVHIIERTHEHLVSESRSLALRSPSPIARRLLDISHRDHAAQLSRRPGLLSEPI